MTANIVRQAGSPSKRQRAAPLGQKPYCVWFTGLSGSGKSTLAAALGAALQAAGRHVYVLDGDNVRHGLNRDLGYGRGDRVENIRRVAEVASLMVDAGLIVLVAIISPFHADRAKARHLFAPGDFCEVFVDAPLDVCERRDTKGLYAKARRGELNDFTGIDSPYELPVAPEVRVKTAADPLETCLAAILRALPAA
jgi:bifunctional enzyme CysN/CysC